MSQLELNSLSFHYRNVEAEESPVLDNISLRIEAGECVAICGPSGSGKSTLLYILGAMLKPNSGHFYLNGNDVWAASHRRRDRFRAEDLGFVFQQFHLLPKLNVLQNVLLPARYPAETRKVSKTDLSRAEALLESVGLKDHIKKFPNQLSGGQQQRVAIARALFKDPPVILADEPTGNLDSSSSDEIMKLLLALNQKGKTVVIITHDREIAQRCGRTIWVKDGKVVEFRASDPGHHQRHSGQADQVKRSLLSNKSLLRHFDALPLGPAALIRLLVNTLPLAWANICANWIRSLLTMLGVVIGIASVVTLLTLGHFAKDRILESFDALGVNKLTLTGYYNWRQSARDVNPVSFRGFEYAQDFDPMRSAFPQIRYLSPELQFGRGLESSYGGEQVLDSEINGINEQWLVINNQSVKSGQNFTPHHISESAPVCLIGSEIDSELFRGRDSLGETIYLGDGQQQSFHCRIRGVLRPVNSAGTSIDVNKLILLPYTYLQKVLSFSWERTIDRAALQLYPHSDIKKTADRIKGFYVHRYGSSGTFKVSGDDELVGQMRRFLSVFSFLLAGIGMISLGVGGIGIANMMLMSVAERTREIGLRKAVGASRQSIRWQMLSESVLICSGAGMLGILFGIGAYQLAIYVAAQFIRQVQFEWLFDLPAMLTAVISMLSVGVLSGLLPAIKAEKLEVMEALRHS